MKGLFFIKCGGSIWVVVKERFHILTNRMNHMCRIYQKVTEKKTSVASYQTLIKKAKHNTPVRIKTLNMALLILARRNSHQVTWNVRITSKIVTRSVFRFDAKYFPMQSSLAKNARDSSLVKTRGDKIRDKIVSCLGYKNKNSYEWNGKNCSVLLTKTLEILSFPELSVLGKMETEKWSVLKNIWNLIARRFDGAMSANISTNVNQIRELRKCARARFPDFPKEFRRGGETGVINCKVF